MTNLILLHSSDVEIKNHYSFTSCAKWWFQTLCCASRVRGVVQLRTPSVCEKDFEGLDHMPGLYRKKSQYNL